MKYYPVCLDIRNQDCLVVGGGAVAARKVGTLLDCGAAVTVISPAVCDELTALETEGTIALVRRGYAAGDLTGRFLVIGATNDEALNRKISEDAREARLLCNIADFPEACNFILPSIINRGDLILTISTSGQSPAFAKRLRKSLEKLFGEEYTEFLRLMGAIRENLLATEHAPEAHKPLFETLLDKGLLELVRDGKTEDINRLLQEVLGEGFDYNALMQSANNG